MLSTSRIFIYSIKVVWVKLYNYYKYKMLAHRHKQVDDGICNGL